MDQHECASSNFASVDVPKLFCLDLKTEKSTIAEELCTEKRNLSEKIDSLKRQIVVFRDERAKIEQSLQVLSKIDNSSHKYQENQVGFPLALSLSTPASPADKIGANANC